MAKTNDASRKAPRKTRSRGTVMLRRRKACLSFSAATPDVGVVPSPTRASAMKPRVLVVDDISPTREMLVEALAYLGYEASSAEDGATALELVSRFRPAAVCLDLWMGGMSGGDVLDRLTRDHPGLPVIMITADPLIDTRHAMCARGAVGYLSKPFDLEQLGDVLGSALGRKHG